MTIRTLISILLMIAWLGTAAAVAADCEPAGPLDQVVPAAPVAFVGTVLESSGSMALFEVREVWAGQVGPSVEVHGLTSGVAIGEDDRQWVSGATYLVLPFIEGGVLRDHICTATTEWHAGLEELRPAGARIVEASEPESTVPIELLAIGVVGIIVAGASVLAFRRR